MNKANVAELQKQLEDAERKVEMTEQTRIMHGITCPEQQGIKLDLTPTIKVNFERMTVKVMLDTDSLVTIVPAKMFLEVLVKHCLADQTSEEWKDS